MMLAAVKEEKLAAETNVRNGRKVLLHSLLSLTSIVNENVQVLALNEKNTRDAYNVSVHVS
jgi:hypothetical protein